MILQICLMLVQKWQSRSKGLGSSSVALCLKLLNLARLTLFPPKHAAPFSPICTLAKSWLCLTELKLRSALSSDGRIHLIVQQQDMN